jgi:hypothetical protein
MNAIIHAETSFEGCLLKSFRCINVNTFFQEEIFSRAGFTLEDEYIRFPQILAHDCVVIESMFMFTSQTIFQPKFRFHQLMNALPDETHSKMIFHQLINTFHQTLAVFLTSICHPKTIRSQFILPSIMTFQPTTLTSSPTFQDIMTVHQAAIISLLTFLPTLTNHQAQK